jgi:hypothetical protein
MAVRFGERGSIKDYVYIHDTGVKCKLGKFKGVYVLKTVDVSQVAAAHKVETKRVIEPKLHVDTDLWYYFGRKRPPNTGGIVVRENGISQYCGRSPMPAIAGIQVANWTNQKPDQPKTGPTKNRTNQKSDQPKIENRIVR